MRNITDIIVHHSASTWGCSNEIDEWHRDRGWDEVGYHWVICNGLLAPGMKYNTLFDGMLERGRRPSQTGAHWKAGNQKSIGICLIGLSCGYTTLQMLELHDLLIYLMAEHNVPVSGVRGHYEVDPRKPECPMLNMQAVRDRLAVRRSWDVGDVVRT